MSLILAKLGRKAFRKRHLDAQKSDIAIGQRETTYSKTHPGNVVDVQASTGSDSPRTPILDIIGNRISNVRNLGFGFIKAVEDTEG